MSHGVSRFWPMEFQSEKWKTFCEAAARGMGIKLAPQQTEQFAIHAKELMQWNMRINLTAITDPLEIAVKHFIDSIALTDEIPQNARLIDIGSGGGFPGVPLKIMLPSLNVALVDASRKKISFLKQIIRMLKLKDIDAFHARAQDLPRDPAFAQAFDVAVSRAFTSLDRFVGVAAPLVKPDGKILAMKGKKAKTEINALTSHDCGTLPNAKGRGSEIYPELRCYTLPHVNAQRFIVILKRSDLNLTQPPAVA